MHLLVAGFSGVLLLPTQPGMHAVLITHRFVKTENSVLIIEDNLWVSPPEPGSMRVIEKAVVLAVD